MSDKGEPKQKSWPECCADCTHDWQSKELTPDSNELLNIFLMILGGIAILYGLMTYFPAIFSGLSIIFTPEVLAFMGVLGTSNLILGAFALLAGIGMFKEQEWAWGMALMVLVFIIANTISAVINYIIGGAFNWQNIIMWLQIISCVVAVIGIPWLLATKARYR
jgi:cytochrome b subunit of formate dehydrogenase